MCPNFEIPHKRFQHFPGHFSFWNDDQLTNFAIFFTMTDQRDSWFPPLLRQWQASQIFLTTDQQIEIFPPRNRSTKITIFFLRSINEFIDFFNATDWQILQFFSAVNGKFNDFFLLQTEKSLFFFPQVPIVNFYIFFSHDLLTNLAIFSCFRLAIFAVFSAWSNFTMFVFMTERWN